MPLTTVSQGLLSTDAQYTGFKNRIINGAMMIDQRNAGASVTISNSTDTYYLDRYASYTGTNSNNTIQRSSTAPAGFINSLQITIGTGASPASGTPNYFYQNIEGLNCADLGWGTASASPVTISFWVRSSVTGTFSGALSNNSVNRSYPFTYVISSANTFEYKTVTIAGDTSGTWLTTNGVGIRVWFDLGSGSNFQGTAGAWAGADRRAATGSTQLVATSGATLFLTGVQLEKGSTATSFDYRPYGTELALCQRYFVNTTQAACMSNINSRYISVCTRLNPVPMRATPSVSVSGTYTFNPFFGGGIFTSSNAPTLQRNLSDNFIINMDMGGSTGTSGFGEFYNATLSISAEL